MSGLPGEPLFRTFWPINRPEALPERALKKQAKTNTKNNPKWSPKGYQKLSGSLPRAPPGRTLFSRGAPEGPKMPPGPQNPARMTKNGANYLPKVGPDPVKKSTPRCIKRASVAKTFPKKITGVSPVFSFGKQKLRAGRVRLDAIPHLTI